MPAKCAPFWLINFFTDSFLSGVPRLSNRPTTGPQCLPKYVPVVFSRNARVLTSRDAFSGPNLPHFRRHPDSTRTTLFAMKVRRLARPFDEAILYLERHVLRHDALRCPFASLRDGDLWPKGAKFQLVAAPAAGQRRFASAPLFAPAPFIWVQIELAIRAF